MGKALFATRNNRKTQKEDEAVGLCGEETEGRQTDV